MKTRILAAILILIAPAILRAQATRTWVSGVGDDANPGSRTAPCKTFAGAISKTAAGGEISVLDPGGFGAVTITKSITIDGGGIEGSILGSGTNGVVINAADTDVVTIRNVRFEGAGTGLNAVRIVNARTVFLEHCAITGFQGGISFEATAPGAQLFVKNCHFRNCTSAGITLAPTDPGAFSKIEDSRIEGSASGLTVTGGTALALRTTAAGNAGPGFLANTGTTLTIQSCASTGNVIGISALGNVFLADTTVASNTTNGLLRTAPGNITSFRNNRVIGNNPNGAPNKTTVNR